MLVQYIARDSFVDALDDLELQVNVMEKEPATIEDALSIAIRLEAYRAAFRLLEAPQASISKGEAATKTGHVNVIRSTPSAQGQQLPFDLHLRVQFWWRPPPC